MCQESWSDFGCFGVIHSVLFFSGHMHISIQFSMIWEQFCHRDFCSEGIWNIEILKSEDVTAEDVACGLVEQDGHCFGHI